MNQMVYVFVVVIFSAGIFSVSGQSLDEILRLSGGPQNTKELYDPIEGKYYKIVTGDDSTAIGSSNETVTDETSKGIVPPNCNNQITPLVPTRLPALPNIVYSSNCDFCDHDLYTLNCIPTAFDCAARCAADSRCSHFTYIANVNRGTCRLKRAMNSGGGWATIIPSRSAYVCGYVVRRACTPLLLSLCVGLDVGIN